MIISGTYIQGFRMLMLAFCLLAFTANKPPDCSQELKNLQAIVGSLTDSLRSSKAMECTGEIDRLQEENRTAVAELKKAKVYLFFTLLTLCAFAVGCIFRWFKKSNKCSSPPIY